MKTVVRRLGYQTMNVTLLKSSIKNAHFSASWERVARFSLEMNSHWIIFERE